MDEDIKFLTFKEAKAMLPKGSYIHTFRNPGGMLVGADWKRSEILEALEKYKPQLSGEMATRMKHGIVFEDDSGYVFVATK